MGNYIQHATPRSPQFLVARQIRVISQHRKCTCGFNLCQIGAASMTICHHTIHTPVPSECSYTSIFPIAMPNSVNASVLTATTPITRLTDKTVSTIWISKSSFGQQFRRQTVNGVSANLPSFCNLAQIIGSKAVFKSVLGDFLAVFGKKCASVDLHFCAGQSSVRPRSIIQLVLQLTALSKGTRLVIADKKIVR